MKCTGFLCFLFLLFSPQAFSSESWKQDASRGHIYYEREEFDAAWLFYRRALAAGHDDGVVWYRAARSYRLQTMEENEALLKRLYTVARHYLKKQYPNHRYIGYTDPYVDEEVTVTGVYLRRSSVMLGGRPPGLPWKISELSRSLAAFFGTHLALIKEFWSRIWTGNLRTILSWARTRAWDLLLAWFLLSLLTGIILPLVMALTAAREGLKSYVAAYAFLLHWGPLGIHRFYVGKHITGLIWLLTGGLLGIGVFFDLFLTGTFVNAWNRGRRPKKLRRPKASKNKTLA